MRYLVLLMIFLLGCSARPHEIPQISNGTITKKTVWKPYTIFVPEFHQVDNGVWETRYREIKYDAQPVLFLSSGDYIIRIFVSQEVFESVNIGDSLNLSDYEDAVIWKSQ